MSIAFIPNLVWPNITYTLIYDYIDDDFKITWISKEAEF